jgi:hypothetical protein
MTRATPGLPVTTTALAEAGHRAEGVEWLVRPSDSETRQES